MKFFLIEGKFNNPIPVGGSALDSLIKKYNKTIEKGISKGKILFSGSKSDLSGFIFIMRAKNKEEVDEVIEEDLLYKEKVQFYNVIEFKCNNVNENIKEWFSE